MTEVLLNLFPICGTWLSNMYPGGPFISCPWCHKEITFQTFPPWERLTGPSSGGEGAFFVQCHVQSTVCPRFKRTGKRTFPCYPSPGLNKYPSLSPGSVLVLLCKILTGAGPPRWGCSFRTHTGAKKHCAHPFWRVG